jgi:phosphoribosylformimino-5-aminoimidazole carboxamide ribotide isomerase
MLIIPVVDIRQGHVVHACKGMRSNYQPIQSRLTTGSDPVKIINTLLKLYPFEIFYIADLDAIENHGNNNVIIESFSAHFPATRFWIDAGITTGHTLPYHGVSGFQSVLGSENRLSYKDTSKLLAHKPEPVLSLDFSEFGLIGDQELLQRADIWPGQIIVMTMHRVGSSSGPDFERFQMIQHLAPSKSIFAAGGIRHQQDLENLEQYGAAGALVATSLHDLTITSEIILSLSR